MTAVSDRLDFAPPPTPGLLRSLALAILAHAFLLAALTWGLRWHSESVSVTAEAELWSALPQQAAPKPVEPPPAPEQAPPPVPVATPAPPPQPDAEIALAREKQRLKIRQEQERRDELEKQRLEKLKQDKLLLEKKRLQDKREQERKALESKKALEEKQKAEQESKRKEALAAQQDAKKLEQMRQENLRRMSGLAGASGAAGASGTAQQSSGPSAGYAGRIRASIKPNIVFTEQIAGNPMAEVEVRAAPDGTIVGRKLLKSSGIPAYDEAVLRAIDKTDKLPRDVDGRLPATTLIINFRPKD